jgi:formate dehydrogenase subunit gamma
MRNTVVRFTASERWFHNIVMTTFVFLFITGLAMLYFNLIGERGEPREFLVISHEIVAMIFIVGPLYAFFRGDRKIWRENAAILTRWSRSDLAWLTKKPLTVFFKNISLPRDDKFNPGQKAWATAAISGVTALVVTGLYMMFAESPILALFLHTATAIGMVVALSGHVFMALINPATRDGIGSIIDGEVDAEWAMEHHPLWVERSARDRIVARIEADGRRFADGHVPMTLKVTGDAVRVKERARSTDTSTTLKIQAVRV